MKDKTKIIFLSIISVIAFMLCANNAYALTENERYILENQGSKEDVELNNRNLKERQKLLNEFIQEESKKISTVSLPGDYLLLNYPNYKQSKYYYCGPASVKQAIQYLASSSSSQDTYAKNMESNGDKGTLVYKITQELNKYQKKHTYAHQVMKQNDFSTFVSAIKQNIKSEVPTILHAKTKSLYLYNGDDIGHYITAIGYNEGVPVVGAIASSMSLTYMDTYDHNYGRGTTLGSHKDTSMAVFQTVYNNRYIIY